MDESANAFRKLIQSLERKAIANGCTAKATISGDAKHLFGQTVTSGDSEGVQLVDADGRVYDRAMRLTAVCMIPDCGCSGVAHE